MTTFDLLKQTPSDCNATSSHVHHARHQLLHKLRRLLAHSIQENIEDKVPHMTHLEMDMNYTNSSKDRARCKHALSNVKHLHNIYNMTQHNILIGIKCHCNTIPGSIFSIFLMILMIYFPIFTSNKNFKEIPP